ncbi:MAG: cobalt ECF transporter T component CbiQ [Bacteroidota bacterium]
MSGLERAARDLQHLEELAGRDTPVHRRHPLAKVLTTLAFLVVAATFPKYAWTGLLPLAAYPVAVIAMGELPGRAILRRLLPAMPFALFLGLANLFLDRTVLGRIGALTVTGGWVSLAAILTKVGLTVAAALTLVATSGLPAVCAALSRLRVPRIFLAQLLLIYRYLFVLGEEAARTARAYALRAPESRGIHYRAWGSLLGQILLRALARAQRIHQAMLCRGFGGEFPRAAAGGMGWGDLAWVAGWSLFFIAARIYDLPLMLGALLTGGRR